GSFIWRRTLGCGQWIACGYYARLPDDSIAYACRQYLLHPVDEPELAPGTAVDSCPRANPMSFLPIVQRELQSRSRRGMTYWGRCLTVSVAVLFCFQFFFTYGFLWDAPESG